MNKIFSGDIFSKLVGIASNIHRELGAGYPKYIYKKAFLIDLKANNINYEENKIIPINYKGNLLDELKLELIIKNSLIVDIINNDEQFKNTKTELLLFSRVLNKKALILDFSSENFQYKRIIYKSHKKGYLNAY